MNDKSNQGKKQILETTTYICNIYLPNRELQNQYIPVKEQFYKIANSYLVICSRLL